MKYLSALMMGTSFGGVEEVEGDCGGACGGSRAAVLIDGSTNAMATPVRSGWPTLKMSFSSPAPRSGVEGDPAELP